MTELKLVELLVSHFAAHCGLEIAMPRESRLLRRASAIAFALMLLAAGLCQAEGDPWSGIRAYVSDPVAVYNGRSACQPCNQWCGDTLAWQARREDAGGRGFPLGFVEWTADFQPYAIVICRAHPGMATPTFVSVKNGVEGKSIVGYDPAAPGHTLNDVFDLHPCRVPFKPPAPIPPNPVPNPAPNRPNPAPPDDQGLDFGAKLRGPARDLVREVERPVVRERIVEKPVYIERKVYVAAPALPKPVIVATAPPAPVIASANAYTPHWTWPGRLRNHLIEHGWPASYVDSLTPDQKEALHDRDHDTGRVTPRGAQRWPAAFGAAPRPLAATRTYSAVAPTRSSTSRGFDLFGVPVYRQHASRSAAPPTIQTFPAFPVGACPNGACPY